MNNNIISTTLFLLVFSISFNGFAYFECIHKSSVVKKLKLREQSLFIHVSQDTLIKADPSHTEKFVPLSSGDYVRLIFDNRTYLFEHGYFLDYGDGDHHITILGQVDTEPDYPPKPIYLSFEISHEGESQGFFINERKEKLRVDFRQGNISGAKYNPCHWTLWGPEN